MTTEELVEVWRGVIVGDVLSWVLFEHGTLVALPEPADDLALQATELLGEFGPVQVASPAADFNTVDLEGAPGWAVTGHHSEVMTYVAPEEIEADDPTPLIVGLLGRSKRDRDGRELNVVHVEDNR